METKQTDCVYFGAISEEVRSKWRSCKKCKIDNQLVYQNCINESNVLLNTFTNSNETTKTNGENNMETENPVEQPVVKTTEVNDKPKRKPAVVTKGVLNIAKNLIKEGKNDREVIESLIMVYTSAGKGYRQAKHNALTTLFHAHKRVRDGK